VDEELKEEGYNFIFHSPKFSPDGKTIAVNGAMYYYEERESGIFLYDLQARDGFKLIFAEDSNNLDWAPDGEWIVFSSGADIYKIRRDGSEKTLIWNGSRFGNNCWINGLNLSYDGKYIVIGLVQYENYKGKYSVLLLNSDGTGEPKVLVNSSHSGMYPHFDPMPSKVLYNIYAEYGEKSYIEQVNIDNCDYERVVEGYYPTTTLGCKYIYFERDGDIWEMRIY